MSTGSKNGLDYDKLTVGWVDDIEPQLEAGEPELLDEVQIEFAKGEVSDGKRQGKIRVSDISTESVAEFNFKSGRVALALEEMKIARMPLAVVSDWHQDKSQILLMTIPRTVKSITVDDELIHVRFKEGCSATPYFVAKRNINKFKEMYTKLVRSRDEEVAYWIVILDIDDRLQSTNANEIVEVLHPVEPRECDFSCNFSYPYTERRRQLVDVKSVPDLFYGVKNLEYDPLNSSMTNGHIPFRYVSDGCEERAHEVCRYLLDQDIEPQKIWAFARDEHNLIVLPTAEHPNCRLEWAFHVAPMVLTDNGFYVLDPALFDEGVKVEQWYDKFRNHETLLYNSAHHVFSMDQSLCLFRPDPKFERTERNLMFYRVNLALLWQRFGEPPYDFEP